MESFLTKPRSVSNLHVFKLLCYMFLNYYVIKLYSQWYLNSYIGTSFGPMLGVGQTFPGFFVHQKFGISNNSVKFTNFSIIQNLHVFNWTYCSTLSSEVLGGVSLISKSRFFKKSFETKFFVGVIDFGLSVAPCSTNSLKGLVPKINNSWNKT